MNLIILFKDFFIFFTLIVVFTVPYDIILNSSFVIILAIIWILRFNLKEAVHRIRKNAPFWIFVSLYLILILGLINTSNINDALSQLERKLTILAFPVIYGTSVPLSKRRIVRIIAIFLISCIIATFICFLGGYTNFIKHQTYDYFFYQGFTSFLRIHPTYLGAYICFCISSLILFKLDSLLPRLLSYILVIYLILILILLGARIALISSFIIIIISCFEKIGSRQKIIYPLLLLLLFFCFLISSTKNSIGTYIFSRSRLNIDEFNKGKSERLQIWKASLTIFKKRPILGYGTGDVEEKLLEEYRRIAFKEGFEKKLNAHSEYIQEALRHGIVGEILFVLVLGTGFVISKKNKDQVYFYFLILISVSCLTESFLSLQKGVVFFAFFNSIFAFKQPPS